MNKLLAIYDEEITYSERLSKILGSEDSFPFEISSYSSLNNLLRDISNGHIACALISMDAYSELSFSKELKISISDMSFIILDNGTYTFSKASTHTPHIWKYQSGEKIKKDLLDILSSTELPGTFIEAHSHRQNTKLISVFSVSNKEYNSSLSVLISNCLSDKGKTLCIILDAFCGFEELSYSSKDITDLLYYTSSDGKNIAIKLASITTSIDGVDYIAPPFSYFDFFSITENDWLKLINILIEEGTYTNIVISLSELTSGLFEILSKSDLFVSIHDNKPYFDLCEMHFEKLLSESGFENVLSKRLEFTLPKAFEISPSISSLKYDKSLSDTRHMLKEAIDARLKY